MNIDLFPHNQETYNKIIAAWQTQNRVATVQATGTGKTFLILKCIYTYPTVNKVILAPSNHILDQFIERVDENGLPNTTLLTYAKLSFMSEEDIQALNPELIVLDEFHRVGATEWGKGVETLLNMFPNAKLLGTTATPIRHLDNGRDMSDELFDGNVVTNLSLPQAVVKGILPMPKYISALYTFDEEVLNIQNKIKKSSNNESEKAELNKIVSELKHKLQKSNGVPSILKKHLKDQTGKFVVFCKDSEHLEQMKETVAEWFKAAKIGKKIETYSVLHGRKDNDEQIQLFIENKNTDNLILLFSIDMLNEGLHVKDVTGVILLRPTTSPIIYFQQIGRSLEAGKKKSPIVFDLVNNFNSLGSQTLNEGLREAVNEENGQRDETEQGRIEIDQFEIYDEVHEISEVFAEIEGRLRDDWDLMFEKWKKGDYDKSDKKMKTWISTQRHFYKHKTIPTERIEKLESEGFVWDPADIEWETKFEKFKNTPKDQLNKTMKSWVIAQRFHNNKGNLSKERMNKLKAVGFQWEPRAQSWENSFNMLLEYYWKNKNSDVSFEYEVNKIKLGHWVGKQRIAFKKGRMSRERIDKLNELRFKWEPTENSWNENYNILLCWWKKQGSLNITISTEIDGNKIGLWVKTQRKDYKKGKLSQEKIDQLNKIGFRWVVNETDSKNKLVSGII